MFQASQPLVRRCALLERVLPILLLLSLRVATSGLARTSHGTSADYMPSDCSKTEASTLVHTSVFSENAPSFPELVFTEKVMPVVVVTTTPVSCNGGSNGTALAVATGIPPFTYHWSNGATTASISALVAGTFTVTVTDGLAATATASGTVIQPLPLSLNVTVSGQINCLTPTVTLTALASGGNAGFTFNWSNGASGSVISVGAAATYTVTCTDVLGCASTSTKTVTANLALPTVSLNVANPLTCTTPTTQIALTTNAGLATYAWVGPSGFSSTLQSPICSLPGTYTVTVTNTATGCTNTSNATVTANLALPTVSLNVANPLTCTTPTTQIALTTNAGLATYVWAGPSGFTSTVQSPICSLPGTYTVTVTNTATGCTNTSNATVTANLALPTVSLNVANPLTCLIPTTQIALTTNAGLATYIWVGPSGFSSTLQSPICSLPGTYTVTVTNTATGCTNTSNATVTGNLALPTVSLNVANPLTCTTPTTQIALTTNAGLATYVWAGPSGFSSTVQSPTVSLSGTYTVTVTNTATGCTNTSNATVTGNLALPTVSLNVGNMLTCAMPTTQIALTTNAGLATYVWAGPGGFSSTLQSPSASLAGTYTVTVTNTATGCTNTATATVSANLTLPTASAGISLVLTCMTPQIQLNGTASSSGAGISLQWTASAGGNIVAGANTATPTVNAAGTYSLVVTNTVTGCSASASTTVTSNVSLPTVTLSVNGQLSCTQPSVTISLTTNAGLATYLWAGPSGFTSTLQSPVISAPGTYSVTVTATATGCTNTASATVTANANLPVASAGAALSLNCLTAQVQLNGTGSSSGAGFSLQWTASAGGNIVAGANTATPTVNAAGTYTLVVTNSASGCTASASTTVTLATTPPTVNVAASGTLNCLISSVLLNLTTNAAAASFSWTGPSGFSSSLQNPACTLPGTYTVVVTNLQTGCTASASVTVTSSLAMPTASIAAAGALGCSGTSLTLNATASSQGQNFNYLWTTHNGNITAGANTLTPTVNAAGTYNLLITNTLNGCTASASVTVGQGTGIALNSSALVGVACAGGANGSITLSATSGAGGSVSYLWSNGATTNAIANLAAGAYTVTISDAQGCSMVRTFTVLQPAALSLAVTSNGVSGVGLSDGSASASVSGGTAPYLYLWSNGQTTASISSLAAGTYTLTVTDAHGCTSTQTVVVNTGNCHLSVQLTASASTTCTGSANGQISVSASGGTGPLLYLWSNGAVSASLLGLAAGTYTVTVTDLLGCMAIQTATVQASATGPSVALLSVSNANCGGSGGGSASVGVSGGAAPYLYLWSNGQATASISGLSAGQFSLTVTDANGCTATQTVMVQAGTDVQAPVFVVAPTVLVACAGNPLFFSLPTATDNCTNPPTVLQISGPTSGTVFPDCPQVLVFQAVDAAGNATVMQQLVVSVDVPSVTIDLIVDDHNGLGLGSIQVSPGCGPLTFAWTGPNGFTAKTEDIFNLFMGTYTLVATNAAGCSVTLTLVVQDLLGWHDTQRVGAVHLWPNPTSAGIRLFLTDDIELVSGKILDPQGRTVRTLNEADLSAEIAVQQMPAGVYFLYLQARDNRWHVVKFVKAD